MTLSGDKNHKQEPQSITRRNLAAGLAILATAMTSPTGAQAFFGRTRPGRQGGGGDSGSDGRACFLPGTRIQIPGGEVEVEKLCEGDLVRTSSGQACAVKQIFSWRVERGPYNSWDADIAPVKIARSALAPNVPHRDLYVSPEHAIYMDGALVSARLLVNGRSIVRCEKHEADELNYFHIELEDHQVIFAEGAPVESFLDEDMALFAPTFRGKGRRADLASRLRSAASPWVDCRTAADKARDRLDERAFNWSRIVS